MSSYWKCQIVGWVLYTLVVMSLLIFEKLPLGNLIWQLPLLLIVIGISTTHIQKRIFKGFKVFQKSIASQIIWLLIFTFFGTIFFIMILNLSVGGNLEILSFTHHLYLNYFQFIFISAAVLIWNLAYFVFLNFKRVRKEEKDKNLLKIELLEMEGKSLRAQMNPHFIFNCLSSINHFILQKDSQLASDYLTKFSLLIRMVLNNSQRKLITLEEELEMLKLYLDLEQLRFNNSFEYNFICNDIIDAGAVFIPPLIFQPFAENAIWHGLMHKDGDRQLSIEINLGDSSELYCTITDNGIGRKKAAELKSKTSEKRKSFGLQISKQRLALINKETNKKNFYEIVDLKNEMGIAVGTKVILKFQYTNIMEGPNLQREDINSGDSGY